MGTLTEENVLLAKVNPYFYVAFPSDLTVTVLLNSQCLRGPAGGCH